MDAANLASPELARAHHLLVVSADVQPAELEALALSLNPEAAWIRPGLLSLRPGVELSGPWAITTAVRAELGLPAWANAAWALGCPRQRGGVLPGELWGIDPLQDALASALPEGRELEALTDLRKMARRLAGALLLADNWKLVTPDPDGAVDMLVVGPVWLEPGAAQSILAGIFPGIRLLGEEQFAPPAGAPLPLAGLRATLREAAQLSEGERAWLHAEADAFDEAALAEFPVLDAYALSVALTRLSDINLLVHAETQLPPALQGLEWAARGAIFYHLHWDPRDSFQAYQTRPPRTWRQERAAALRAIEKAAPLIATAVSGVTLDADGFLVAFA